MIDNFEILLYSFHKHIKKTTKNVRFSKNIYIYLIPKYYEILNHKDLWWSETDLIEIRQNAILEMQCLMNKHPFMKLNHAKKLLYQPNNITSYDPNNFEDV